MKHVLPLLLITIVLIGCSKSLYNIKSISQNELLKHKVDANSFELGWFTESSKNKPLFRDYGTIDNEITRVPDIDTTSIFYKSNQPQKTGLSLMFETIKIDNKKNVFHLKGKIIENQEDSVLEDFKIYIGHRKNTTVNVAFEPSSNLESYYKGSLVETTINFHLEAFYLSDFKKFNVQQPIENLNEVSFNVSRKIEDKSILVIAQSSPYRYVEIFEIGKLLKD